MKYDINKLLDLDYLNEILSNFNNELNQLSFSFSDFYNLEDFTKMDIDKINSLFRTYNIDNSNLIQYLQNDFIDDEWEFADLYSEDISLSIEQKSNLKNRAIAEIGKLNSVIVIEKTKNDKKRELIEREIINVKNLIRIFDETTMISEEDVLWLYSFLSAQNFTNAEKYNFSSVIVKLLISKNRDLSQKENEENLQEFETKLDDIYSTEETIDINYDECIFTYYSKYKIFFDEVQLGGTLEDVIDIGSSLGDEVQSINSLDDFCIKFVSLLGKLHNARITGDEDLYKIIETELQKLDQFFETHKNNVSSLKNDVDNLLSKINYLDVDEDFLDELVLELEEFKKEFSVSFVELSSLDRICVRCNFINQTLNQLFNLTESNRRISDLLKPSKIEHTGDYYTKLSGLRSEIMCLIDKVIKDGYSEVIEASYNGVCKEIKNYQIDESSVSSLDSSKKVQLSGFVLFDIGPDNELYVLKDLNNKDKNTLIDNSIIANKLNSGFSDYSNLIRDLLLYGAPEALHNGTTNAYADKIMGSVFYDEAGNRSTGMVRIRPTRSSIVRFVCKEVVLTPGSEIYTQVTNLLSEMLPSLIIDESKSFSLFINFSSALKKSSTGSYDEAIKRYDRKGPLYKLFFTNKNDQKQSLSDEELNLLREIIKMTLEGYYDLEKYNDKLRFDIITQIGGKKTRG